MLTPPGAAQDGVWDILRRSLGTHNPTSLRVTALQGLHALSSDRFSLDDVMADEEFEGYYADCLQLAEELTANAHLKPVLTFEDLNVLQRRKVHIVSQFAKLNHVSSGPPSARIVTVASGSDSASFENPIQDSDEDEISMGGSHDGEASEPTKIMNLSHDGEADNAHHMMGGSFDGEDKDRIKAVKTLDQVHAKEDKVIDPFAKEFYEKNRTQMAVREASVLPRIFGAAAFCAAFWR